MLCFVYLNAGIAEAKKKNVLVMLKDQHALLINFNCFNSLTQSSTRTVSDRLNTQEVVCTFTNVYRSFNAVLSLCCFKMSSSTKIQIGLKVAA